MGKGQKKGICIYQIRPSFYLFRYLKWRKEKEGLTIEELANTPLFVSLKKPHSRINSRSSTPLNCSESGQEWEM